MGTPNMELIIKQVGLSGKFFETVYLAFMIFFVFLFKISLFWAFLLFLSDPCHKLWAEIELGTLTELQKISCKIYYDFLLTEAGTKLGTPTNKLLQTL